MPSPGGRRRERRGGRRRLVPVNGFARKEALKRAAYYASCGLLHFSGVGRLRSLPVIPGSLRVLMYHKVNDQGGNSLSVPVSLFAEQMAFLKEHYAAVSAADLVAHVETGVPLPARAVLLTFDDGYRDVHRNAHPVLRRLGLPAVLFASTDFIGGDASFPHDRRFSDLDNAVLSWAELREMGDVFEVGAHACSHRPLTSLPSSEARREVFDSKRVIEDRLGRPVRLFSYPKGGPHDFNDEIRGFVKEAGYSLCFTTIPRTNRPPLARFDLARYNVEPYGSFYFRRLLEGSCDLLGVGATPWGASLKRRLVGVMGAATD